MPEGYLKGAQERIKAAPGLLLVAEVPSGISRTGDIIWSFESQHVVPDIMVIAKGMGNGFPLGAVIAKRQVTEAMAKKFYFDTYGANPVSCTAGPAVLYVINEYKLQENAKRVGAELLKV